MSRGKLPVTLRLHARRLTPHAAQPLLGKVHMSGRTSHHHKRSHSKATKTSAPCPFTPQAGRPKTITGFQTHTTPVLLSVGERAELGTEKYIPGGCESGCKGEGWWVGGARVGGKGRRGSARCCAPRSTSQVGRSGWRQCDVLWLPVGVRVERRMTEAVCAELGTQWSTAVPGEASEVNPAATLPPPC